MKMTARRQRLAWVGVLILGVALATVLGAAAFRENLMFFHTPSDIVAGKAPSGGAFRLGGVVTEGSVERDPETLDVRFRLADCDNEVTVQYGGILPDLFREGQGIVTTGRIEDDGRFIAQQVLAKHDENYMPPELAAALDDGTGHSCNPFRPVHASSSDY